MGFDNRNHGIYLGIYHLETLVANNHMQIFTLGRVHVFASSRIPLRLNFFIRAFIYSVPIAFLTIEAISIVRAIRCQTSPEWPAMRYDNNSKKFPLDYAADGGFLYRISSSILYKETDDESCQAVGMAALGGTKLPRGSLSLLWPLFLSLCASQFIEALAAALQGRQPVTENSIFEMSLAFAEAEALVTKPFELSILAGKGAVDATLPMKMSRVKQVMNVTPEVLLLSFIFALSTISSNILAVFNKRKKWRLVNTGVWGITYLAAFMWSLNRLFFGEEDDWNFRFPTVFVVGFIPHLVIIVGTLICGCIYTFALLFTVISPPAGQLETRGFKERLLQAYDNLQANVYLAAGEHIRFSWEDEFYSTLLKAGFTLLTVASEAVYLNEGTNIRVSNMTWLEQDRVNEMSTRKGYLFRKTQQSIPISLKQNLAAAYPSTDEADKNLTGKRTGYSVERKARGPKSNMENLELPDGMLGMAERRSLLAFKFMQGIFWLSMSIALLSILALLSRVGINYRPQWVRKLVNDDRQQQEQRPESIQNKTLDLWLLKDDGTFHLANDPSVDVETEMRAQEERSTGRRGQNPQEPDMDAKLYNWWKLGGWWGDVDSSGDFEPSEQDDDVTSIASTSTNLIDESDAWTDEESSGQRTPTKNDPFPKRQNPNDLLDATALAELLDPHTFDQRQEARMLSRRLRSNGIMTRSQFQRNVDKDRASILTTSMVFNPERKAIEADVEEQMLEQFIIEQRSKVGAKRVATSPQNSDAGPSSWSSGAPGMGNTGPMCVVCQDSPRTILLWPCGCLSMCDDCRVSMATRNFTSCVCCRTATEAFSRLYVP
jgi:hypothetical protein